MSFLASEASMDHQSSQSDAVAFDNVQLFVLEDSETLSCDDTGDLSLKVISKDARLEVRQTDLRIVFVVTSNGGKQLLLAATWSKTDLEFSKAGQLSLVIQNESNSSSGQSASSAVGTSEWMHDSGDRGCYLLRFASVADASSVYRILASAKEARRASRWSVFERRTEASSAEQYFQFYSLLSQQQNMLQDYVRTSTYQRAMLANAVDFRDKVVMDVGAGSGILSFFAVQAGAKRVYAVEASASAAQYCETLVNANRLAGRIIVMRGKLEEIELDEQVDVLVSEPLGYMLLNERMLETFLHAKKFLRVDAGSKAKSKSKSDSAGHAGTGQDAETSGKHPLSVGRLFPSRSDLYIAPFSDEVLFTEVQSKANFWHQPSFYGCVDLSALRDAAQREYFRQPVVDTFDMRVCCAPPVKHTLDFATAEETDLVRIDVPLRFVASQSTTVHGLAFWFDVAFAGSTTTVWLSTSPTEPLTHWYQVRCLVPTPIFVHAGQTLTGRLLLNANSRQSYDVDIELELQCAPVNGCELSETRTIRARNSLDLKNPLFRYTGAPVQPPPGSHTQQSSPTELFWQAQQTAAAAAYNPAAALGVGIGAAPYAVPVTGTQTVVNGAIPQTAAFPAVAMQNGAIVNQQFVPVAGTAGYNVLLGGNAAQSLYGTTMQQFAS